MQFPHEVLSGGEIMGRYELSGVAALKDLPDGERARLQHQYQASMTVAGPEGEKPHL
jgi:hypothetical protein